MCFGAYDETVRTVGWSYRGRVVFVWEGKFVVPPSSPRGTTRAAGRQWASVLGYSTAAVGPLLFYFHFFSVHRLLLSPFVGEMLVVTWVPPGIPDPFYNNIYILGKMIVVVSYMQHTMVQFCKAFSTNTSLIRETQQCILTCYIMLRV